MVTIYHSSGTSNVLVVVIVGVAAEGSSNEVLHNIITSGSDTDSMLLRNE